MAILIILIVLILYAYREYRELRLIQYWTECHPFIDLIESNQYGLRPDPGGTITITVAPQGETIYTVGTTWPHDHCFDPGDCGNYGFTYSGEYEDCENCTAIGVNTVPVPCIGGGGDGCCEKYLVEISAPYQLECNECATICAITNNYNNPEYEWSTGETTRCIEVCMAGVYSVVVMEQVTEDCMCMNAGVEEILIADNDIFCEIDDNITICEGGSGQLDLTASQGATFLWTGPNGFTSTVEDPIVSDPGLYQVEVTTDDCSIMCSANIFLKDIIHVGQCL